MDCSVKVMPEILDKFSVNLGHCGPSVKTCAEQIAFVHPLKQSEEKIEAHKLNIDMKMLRNREGLHAPLKMAMEMQSTRKVGRLPFLSSSNASFDSLTGRDIIIDFNDILGTPEFSEQMRQPHAVVEKCYGIL